MTAPPGTSGRSATTLRTASLRTRTVLAVLALMVVLLVGLTVSVDVIFGAQLRTQLEDRLEDRAAAAASLVGTVDSDELADRLSAQGLSVRIESAAGEEVVAGPSPDQLRQGPPAGLGPDGGRRPGPATGNGSSDDPTTSGEVSVAASAISGDDQLVTLVSTLSDGSTLTLTASTAPIAATVAQLRTVMAIAAAAVLIIAVIGVLLVVRSTLAPLTRVTTVARSIASGDRGRRLRPDRPRTEIGRVASAFDEMLDDVEGAERSALDAEARMRTFVSDAAHELRTPVAGIRAAADTLVRADLSPADRELLATQIARESGRASRLIDDMLMMARLDRGLDLIPTRVDLGRLVRSEADRLSLRRPSLDLQTRVPDRPVPVDADVDRLGQIVSNLVDNAARATGGDGAVVVEVRIDDADAATARIVVTDDGPGVPAEERERIFDRLVRLDPSRDARAGAGLGLPIARGIARAHGGDVTCVPASRGARFEVTLPLAVA
ncbi:putative sensor histidine kinase TcrY [Microbacterium lemovicicum]|uniref:histidine kinase n=1 Tax=Microbacterium lemovicicum TaxID=1072463 RepID=A0A3Q9J0X4_9MICO|nr:HAMP domain-containing sensor histidine kinase [Microbacterium lemovicicum]AZS38620.1 putative sensor histidine kinase TcrY [Microbacterium lemovicicum]